MQHYESLNRMKDLFCELFQLDTADLDFGLYHLFRLNRTEIETFLDKQLPAEVDQAFKAVTGEEREKLQKEVAQLAKHARESIADDAILQSGEPNPKYTGIKAVKEYAEARKQLEAAEVSEAQRAEVFNHLYTYFSRYYGYTMRG
jgi:adenine-specific DNA-methyltransferase